MEEWIREKDGPAHLVRIRRPLYITTACKLTVPIFGSIRVRTKKIALAQVPAKYIFRPDCDQVCENCSLIYKENS